MMNTSFRFMGTVPASKSLLNRAWIVKSFYPDFKISGINSCEDVKVMKRAVLQFQKGEKEIYCGQSATAFRFMALRVSRKKGDYILSGDSQLLNRPHQELVRVLSQLGVNACFQYDKKLVIQGDGWKPQGDAITVSSVISSQFASAIFLNSFYLDKDLFVSIESEASLSYFNMTLSFLKQLGFEVEGSFPEFQIRKKQTIQEFCYKVEPDMSCLFSLSCLMALNGQGLFTHWLQRSIQPDSIFPSLLKRMGVKVEESHSTLKIKSADSLNAITVNLKSNPDLFPSLAVLCAFAKGESVLEGIWHTQYKESNRLQQIILLLEKIGRKAKAHSHYLSIEGDPTKGNQQPLVLDSNDDHRIAMAMALLKYAHFRVEIKNSHCVNKSFPHFWSIVNQ